LAFLLWQNFDPLFSDRAGIVAQIAPVAQFKYTARSKSGEKLSGIVAASSKAAAVKEVERKGLFPISIDPDNAVTAENTTPARKLFPERIERLDYFLRWLLFFILGSVVAAFLLPLPKYIGIPHWLPFVVVILLFLLRFPCADIPRFRSIGWSRWLALLFIIPIVNIVIQLMLFFKPAKEVECS
jgi:hypothetical protein